MCLAGFHQSLPTVMWLARLMHNLSVSSCTHTHTHTHTHTQNVLAGALFGVWWGVPLVCALTACGASGCYLMSWAFGRRLVETYLSHRIAPLRQRVGQSLVLSLSLVGHGVVPALLWGTFSLNSITYHK